MNSTQTSTSAASSTSISSTSSNPSAPTSSTSAPLTILHVPSDTALYTYNYVNGDASLHNINAAPSTSGINNYTFTNGFAIYLPTVFTTTGVVNLNSLATSVASGFPPGEMYPVTFYTPPGGPSNTILPTSQYTASSGATLYVPFISSITTDLSALNISRLVNQLSSATTSVTTTAMNSMNSTATSSSHTATSSPASGQPATPQPGKLSFPKGEFAGIIIGCVLGALLVGLAFGYFLTPGRSRRRVAPPSNASRKLLPKENLESDHYRAAPGSAPIEMIGWQKHIPQGKPDNVVAEAVRNLLDMVQIFVEGFYDDRKRVSESQETMSALYALESFPVDDLSKSLPGSTDALPLLKGILVRWIIHRISLRSLPRESLLPREYCDVPERCRWHMESDNEGHGYTIADSNKGFRQAFTQWRVMTGFLVERDLSNDPKFKRTLDTKIDQAVLIICKAYAPWSLAAKSSTDRHDSLRQILERAANVGRLIFTQSSTFNFEWTDQYDTRKTMITPAFTKRLDDTGEVLPKRKVLVEST